MARGEKNFLGFWSIGEFSLKVDIVKYNLNIGVKRAPTIYLCIVTLGLMGTMCGKRFFGVGNTVYALCMLVYASFSLSRFIFSFLISMYL